MKKRRNKSGIKSNIIKRQVIEIKELKKLIDNLNITCEQKDEIIGSINGLRQDLIDVITDINDKREQYDALINELIEMKKIINQEVFKGRWKIIRFLLK